MLENLYTTKMSANKKILQNRFTKIRSKNGRISKIMAAVMSCVVAIIMLGATIVMAAVGSDGLEHWKKNEIYFLRSMSFDVNISKKHVPDWVFEDVVGDDGNITVTLRHYQMRHAAAGYVDLNTTVELKGTKGTTRLYMVNGGHINTAALTDSDGNVVRGEVISSFDDPYASSYRFVETTKESGLSSFTEPFISSGIVDADTGKRKCVTVNFGIDEDMTVQGICLNLHLSDEKNALEPSKDQFDDLYASPDSLNLIGGNAETFLNSSWLMYFTEFEDNYKNIGNDSVNISVEKAASDEIIVNSNVALESAEYIDINVLNEEGDVVSISREDFSDRYTLKKDIDYSSGSTFHVGEKYRICIGVLDSDRNLLYRWQEYVTIK